MPHDPTEMCQLLVGLGDIAVLAVNHTGPTTPLVVQIETHVPTPVTCASCGAIATIKDRPPVVLVDLPALGRPTRLRWIKRRWRCPDPRCEIGLWIEVEPSMAGPRLSMTTHAGKWACAQVGRCGRTVSEVAGELGCDWHTINDAVIAYGQQLVDHPDRIGEVTALGLDEILFARRGRWRQRCWSASIVDGCFGRLLDVVEGRAAAPACR